MGMESSSSMPSDSEPRPRGATAPSSTLPAGMLTFLIADVRGYTAYTHQHGDEAGAALATSFASLAGEAVQAQDGQVVEVRGDEVMAVFTSARKALRAAVDLLARCASDTTLPLRAGVGLDVGEPIHVPGGYRGEALNVAARLCAKAGPGEVLASDAVVSLARRIEGLLYEERGSLELKGISRPVGTWLVKAVVATRERPADLPGEQPRLSQDEVHALAGSASGHVTTFTPSPLPRGGYLGAAPLNVLVARESEHAHIERALDDVSQGEGQLILLSGEPGVGKTRLAQEAMLEARTRGFQVLVGRCNEQHASLPFFPFREALTNALAIAPAGLRQQVPERFPELGLVVPDQLPVPPVVAEEEGQLRVLRAVTGFLQALAQHTPLAMLLDDLQWADSASIELLGHLSHGLRGYRVFLLGTYRDADVDRRHPLHSLITALTRGRVLEVLALRRLDRAGTAALIRARFSVDEVSDELVRLVHERTEGNPFFTEEVLTALVEQGAIYREGEAWERNEVDALELPQSVRAVVGQRVERLSEEAQEVLRVASVLGQEWDLDLLLGAVDQSEAEVLDHVEAALNARLVEERRVGRHERYAFSHALVAQVLYDEVPRFRLRRLHRQVGEALERIRGDQSDAAADLTRHFLAGGDEARALRYAIVAGDHAAGFYAYAEAARHYEMALELLADTRDLPATAAVRRKLGDIQVSLHETAKAVQTFQAARAIYEQLGDVTGLAETERALGWAYQRAQDFTAAAPHLEAALRLWPTAQEDAGLARLLLEAARAKALSGDITSAAPLAERGWALAEALNDPALMAQGLIERAIVLGHSGQGVEALALLDQAEPVARRSGARYTLWRVFNNRADIWGRLGELRRSLDDATQAAALANELGQPATAAFSRYNEAETAKNQGDWARGRAAAQAALVNDHTDFIGIRPLLAWMEGAPLLALQLGQLGLDDARRRQDAEAEVDCLVLLGQWNLELGRPEDALAAAYGARELARATGRSAMLGATLAEAAVRCGTPDAAALVSEAAETTNREQQLLSRPQVLRAQGLLLASQSDPAAAVAALRQSAEVARQMGALPDLGKSLAALSQVAHAAGDEQTAEAADRERETVMEQIGPEVRGLAWAR